MYPADPVWLRRRRVEEGKDCGECHAVDHAFSAFIECWGLAVGDKSSPELARRLASLTYSTKIT